MKKYEWEIDTLNEKCIFSKVTFEVFDEQKENVKDALKSYEKNDKNGIEDIIIFMISKIRIDGITLKKAFVPMISNMFKLDERVVENVRRGGMINFIIIKRVSLCWRRSYRIL